MSDRAPGRTRGAHAAPEDAADGDSPHGDSPHGDPPHGDSPHGDSPDGDSPHGDVAHAAHDRDPRLLAMVGVVLVVGAGLAATARIGALALLIAVAVVQALLCLGWVFGTVLPGRIGALLIAAAAAGGADVTVSLWPRSRLGTLLIVFGLAMAVMFVHQLARSAARVRVVESLSGVAIAVVLMAALPALVQLRHEFVPAEAGGRIAAAVVEIVAGALIVGYLVDMVMPAPRFDATVARGLLAVVASAGLGGSVGHLAISNGADFAGARGPFIGAALGALVAFFAVAAAFLDASVPAPARALGRGLRVVALALIPLSLAAPLGFLLLLAVRA